MARRLQVDISDESFNRLTDLKELHESPSYGDIVNKSLKTLAFFSTAKAAGKQIILRDAEGNETHVELL